MWTSYEFYLNQYLQGDTPTIPEQSFKRWVNNAVQAVNKRNLVFADINDFNTLSATAMILFSLDNERTDFGSGEPDDIQDFINAKFAEDSISAKAEVTDDWELVITAGSLSHVYDFGIVEENGEFHINYIEMIEGTHIPAPDVIQKMVCEYAEAIMSYSENTAGRQGLRSERYPTYAWDAGDTKDTKASYEQQLMDIVAKYTAHDKEWRQYFYSPYVGLVR